MTGKQHILILPRWYPNKTDIQLGSFIQQQAILLKDEFHIHVIYVQAIEDQKQTFDIVSGTENGIDEKIVYFKVAKGPLKKIINARRYKKAQRLAFALNPCTPDLCHVHVPYRSAFLALNLRKKGIPFVITEHWSGHLDGKYAKKNPADKKLYKVVLARASGIATVSKLLREKFRENTGFRSKVIPNLINVPPLKPSVDSERIDALTVSDLNDPVKNVSGLIRAFKKAVQTNTDLRLTVIGGGPDEDALKQLVTDLQLNEKIVFRGRLPYEEVLEAYTSCDFYICNSNFETFGMAVAEALAAGKPVVSTRCGGPEEFLKKYNAIMVKPSDDKQLTNAILEMADHYKKYDPVELTAAIQAKFGTEIVKKKLRKFYLKAIHDSTRNNS